MGSRCTPVKHSGENFALDLWGGCSANRSAHPASNERSDKTQNRSPERPGSSFMLPACIGTAYRVGGGQVLLTTRDDAVPRLVCIDAAIGVRLFRS